MKYIDLSNNVEYDTKRMKEICSVNRGFAGITKVYKSSDGVYFRCWINVFGEEKSLSPLFDNEAKELVSGLSKEAYKKEFNTEER